MIVRCVRGTCDGLCECGEPDTVHHRLYTCQLQRVVDARAASEVPDEYLHAARENPDNPIFTRGVHVYEDSELPCPSVSSEVFLHDGNGNLLDMEPEMIADLTSQAPLRLASD
eukprot:2704062-Pyramimonas_sp.AAC.1